MCEKNPLQISSAAFTSNGNPRGRPRKLESVTFSAPPKSIVSQLIQKMITENKVVIPIENSPERTALNDSEYNPESVQDEDCSSQSLKNKKPKRYSCNFTKCLYSTKLSSNLLKHKRRHTEEKPYLCDICSFRTNFSNSLKVHKRLHTSERPYECRNCGYRCNSISNLKKHTHSKHRNRESKMDGNGLEAKLCLSEEKLENT